MRTKRQKAQSERAWRIFRTRGVFYQNYTLTGWRRRLAQWCVDRELAHLGAETETARRCRQDAELEANLRRGTAYQAIPDDEIPF